MENIVDVFPIERNWMASGYLYYANDIVAIHQYERVKCCVFYSSQQLTFCCCWQGVLLHTNTVHKLAFSFIVFVIYFIRTQWQQFQFSIEPNIFFFMIVVVPSFFTFFLFSLHFV